MPRPILAPFLVALAACQAEGTQESAAPEPSGIAAQTSAAATSATPGEPTRAATATPQTTPITDSDCGADKVSARWLNSLPTDDVKADIAAKVGDRPIRYYTLGDPITMDFNPARLNVELGEDGRIKLFRCG